MARAQLREPHSEDAEPQTAPEEPETQEAPAEGQDSPVLDLTDAAGILAHATARLAQSH